MDDDSMFMFVETILSFNKLPRFDPDSKLIVFISFTSLANFIYSIYRWTFI